MSVSGPGGRYREDMTREHYEELTEDLLNRTKNLLDDVLSTAAGKGYPMDRIDKVLLVGGSSRMPQVPAMIERDYHVTPALTDPDEAVAKGAAIYAGNEQEFNDFVEKEAEKAGVSAEILKEENETDGALEKKFAEEVTGYGGLARVRITNGLYRTYGMRAFDENDVKRIYNFLMINDALPASHRETFYTHEDNQDGVLLGLYESRSTEEVMDIEDREPLTEINMEFTRRVPQNTPIDVLLTLDNSGILHITAEELQYHSRLDTTFRLSNQLSEGELSIAAERVAHATID